MYTNTRLGIGVVLEGYIRQYIGACEVSNLVMSGQYMLGGYTYVHHNMPCLSCTSYQIAWLAQDKVPVFFEPLIRWP